MHHPITIYERILKIIEAEGDLPVTPGFIAYQLQRTRDEAEELLDAMVSESMLLYDFNEDGDISYRRNIAYAYQPENEPERGDRPPRQASTFQMHASHHSAATAGIPGAVYGGSDGSLGAASASDPYRNARPYYESHRHPDRRAASSARRPTSGHFALHEQRAGSHYQNAGVIGPDGADGSVAGAPSVGAGPRHAAYPGSARSPHHRHQHREIRQQFQNPNTHLVPVHRARQLPVRAEKRKPKPLLAAMLSLFFAGSGQFYNGDIGKGIIFFMAFLVLWSFSLGWMVQIWAAADAYQSAIDDREEVER